MEISEICNGVKESIKGGFCDETRGGMTTWCLYYKKSGCSETCTYAGEKSKLDGYSKLQK